MSTSSAGSAQPLKVTPSTPAKYAPASNTENDADKTPSANKSTTAAKPNMGLNNISSPHELTAFVENLLENLDQKFDEMSSQILERMTQMSSRVDALEAAIQDIINGDVSGTPSVPPSPSPTAAISGGRKSSTS
ncbi:hypothetical protein D9758_012284 [Tetrapyrgos nigripes]|uniref:Heat shock factor-binding protein 1 n=1 Tax=Tetrapyrgos nigripes TaxID=182062 RepID=A0A8H5FLN4_9AGAR|nr:hypothetical protein D9758_012284 [Tetrapyrgos nigripes]